MNTANPRNSTVPVRRGARIVAAGALLALAPLGVGCNNAGEGAISGAALGALGGLAIGSVTGGSGTGAVIGAVSGAAIGGIIGDQNERNSRREYRTYDNEGYRAYEYR
jgi:outer membrane lipoprotein SlyB